MDVKLFINGKEESKFESKMDSGNLNLYIDKFYNAEQVTKVEVKLHADEVIPKKVYVCFNVNNLPVLILPTKIIYEN